MADNVQIIPVERRLAAVRRKRDESRETGATFPTPQEWANACVW
jgi:hypothetical protein